MVFKKGENGRWMLKKKFTFASVALATIVLIAIKGMGLATSVAEIAILLTAFATTSGGILALIFAADITDKGLNNGNYEK